MSKKTIIIGGTSGIGLETAKYLHDLDYDVVVGGRSNTTEDYNINYAPIDVTDEESVKNFFSNLELKEINSVIYSAGTTTGLKSITEFDVNEYQRVHDVNLLGVILTLKYAYPLLKINKGKVVLISSLAARTYSKLSGFEYTVTKAALSGLVNQLSMEWADDGILINMVLPGMVETPMLHNNVKESILSEINQKIPLGRIAKPDEIAAAIEFLISDKNTYMTGSGIDINGGQFLST